MEQYKTTIVMPCCDAAFRACCFVVEVCDLRKQGVKDVDSEYYVRVLLRDAVRSASLFSLSTSMFSLRVTGESEKYTALMTPSRLHKLKLLSLVSLCASKKVPYTLVASAGFSSPSIRSHRCLRLCPLAGVAVR